MAKFRKIDPRIWNDEKFQKLAPDAKLLAIYCLTAQCNRIGIFKFSVAMAAEDIGCPPDTLCHTLSVVCKTLGWKHDQAHRVLYFPKWWKYNAPDSYKALKGALADAHEVPQTPLLAEFKANVEHLSEALSKTMLEFFGYPIGYPMPYPMAYQEQEQEQEKEQEREREKERPAPVLETKLGANTPTVKALVDGHLLPEAWRVPSALTALGEWCDHVFTTEGKQLDQVRLHKQLKDCLAWPADRLVRSIDKTIAKGQSRQIYDADEAPPRAKNGKRSNSYSDDEGSGTGDRPTCNIPDIAWLKENYRG